MASEVILEGRKVRLELPNKLKGFLMRAQIDEGLSRITETTIEFMSPDIDLDLQKVVGERMRLEINAPKDKTRYFQGHCVAAEYLGSHAGRGYFRANVRPWLWFLTRTSNCRVFQDKSVVDVIKEIFGQHGFSDYKDATKHTYPRRNYCVQYQETDFAFISRLMEEEGIYHYLNHEKTKEILVLADDASAHKAIEDCKEIDFFFREPGYRRTEDHIFEWRGSESIQTGKVTLQDYDFEKPKSDLKTAKALPQGRHAHKTYEVYEYPGRHADTREGEHFARVKVEGFAAQAQRAKGVCNVRQMMSGGKFKLKKHPRKAENAEYLVLSACHQLQIDADVEDREIVGAILGPTLQFDSRNSLDIYRCAFEVQPINMAFRAPQITPRPTHPGVQTAVVVGKRGEEIWTDQYGRVKVQFHWDREGQRDDKSSCWIRTTVPWSGKGWGMTGVPRVGQEVVVQFEDGNPDRPIITGMVYNGETRLPYTLPANQTQSGVKTNSSKGGGGFNELVFEDKKGAEFVRLQSERDLFEIVKNNAELTVGEGTNKGGNVKQTIYGEKTVAIHKDYNVDVGAAMTINAKSKITFKCGSSTIEMTPTEVTISTTKIDFKANATAKLTAGGQLQMEGKGQAALKGAGMLKLEGGGMTQLKSSGMLIAKGALTMIN